MFENTKFPYFFSGQVLRADDLNSLVTYIDAQMRAMVQVNVGRGIVQGLKPTFIKNEKGEWGVKLSSGYGYTSDGYLINVGETKFCKFCASVALSENSFLCQQQSNPALLPLLDLLEEMPKNNGANQHEYALINCLENYLDLANDDSFEGIKPDSIADDADEEQRTQYEQDLAAYEAELIEFAKKNLIVILLRDEKTIEQKFCFNSCDEPTTDKEILVRKLLVKKEVIKAYIDIEQGGEDTDLKGLEKPFIRRLGVGLPQINDDGDAPKNLLSTIQTMEDLQREYYEINKAAIARWTAVITSANWEIYRTTLALSTFPENWVAHLNAHLANFNVNAQPPLSIQYFYTYLRDLVYAFDEFLATTCELDLRASTTYHECSFFGFLPLGFLQTEAQNLTDEAGNASNDESNNSEDNSENNACRVPFIPSNSTGNNDERIKKKAKFYFEERLRKMWGAAGSLLTTMQNANAIKIIPSRGKNYPLSERAMPFYYPNALREFWRFDSRLNEKWTEIPHYQNIAINGDTPLTNPLRFEIEHFDFFRIEGHLGKPLREVVEKVQELRECYNLSFDIQCVKLAADTAGLEEEIKAHATFDCGDLEQVYVSLQNDMKGEMTQHFPNNLDLLPPEDVKSFMVWDGMLALSSFYENRKENEPGKCHLDSLRKLQEELIALKTAFLEGHLFSNYAAGHLGLEHHGGVYKGGTFVVAFTNFDQQNEPMVVADFCLPYLCCGQDNGGSSVTVEPFIFALKKVLCVGNVAGESTQVVTYPSGGTLTAYYAKDGDIAQKIIEKQGNQYIFEPSGLGLPNGAIVTLVYDYQGKTVQTVVSIKQFSFGIKETAIGYCYDENCTLTGIEYSLKPSEDAKNATLDWEGVDSQDPPTVCVPFGEQKTVELTATKGDCISTGELKIEARCPDKITLSWTDTGPHDNPRKFAYHQETALDVAVTVNPTGGQFELFKKDTQIKLDNILTIDNSKGCGDLSYRFKFKEADSKELLSDLKFAREGEIYTLVYTLKTCGLRQEMQFTFNQIRPEREEDNNADDNVTIPEIVILPPIPEVVIPPAPISRSLASQNAPIADLSTQMNQRKAVRKAVLNDDLAKDASLTKLKSFKVVHQFLQSPPNHARLLTDFEDAASLLATNLSKADNPRKKQYRQLLEVLYADFLDRQVFANSNKLKEEAETVLKTLLQDLKSKGVTGKALKKAWNGEKGLKAEELAVIGVIDKLLR